MPSNELDNSWLLDVYTYSDHPNVKSVVDELYDELKLIPMYKKVPSRRKVREHIKLVILNLYDAYLYDPKMYIAFPMNENHYRQDRYNQLHIGYGYLRTIIENLENQGYLNRINGFFDRRTGVSRYSRMQATFKLMEKIVSCEVSQNMLYEHPEREEKEEIIILRDANKRQWDYSESITTTQMREKLKKINRALRDTFVGLFIPDSELHELNNNLVTHPDPKKQPINFHSKRLTRIFNRTEDLMQGGRFYGGWWQNIPKQYRKHIRISNEQPGNWDAHDEEVIELDFDAMHARMLYKEAIDMDWGDRDPFEMESRDPELRGLFKEAFYTIVNAESDIKAAGAIQKKINFGELPDLGMTGAQVLEQVKAHHSQVSHLFCTGEGLRLQRKDSDIAERVMLEMLDHGVVVLPMHDSFVAPAGARELLENKMHTAFLEKFEMPCPISPKTCMGDLRKLYEEHMDDNNEVDLENIMNDTEFDELISKVVPSQDRRNYSLYYKTWDVMQFRFNRKAA